MKGMCDGVEALVRYLRQPREAVRARRRFDQRIVAEPPRNAFAPAPQPILRKLEHTEAAPDLPEGVHIDVADPAPVAELDTELERPARFADELILVDADKGVEQADRRDRRLADADRADLLAFAQPDRQMVHRSRQRPGGQPARGPAAAHPSPPHAASTHAPAYTPP